MIFSESIARNIVVDDGEVDVDRLEQAARIANIHDYIMSLPLKYNTLIGRDGVGLSQGQKQRILIARAVYKQPSFIFLDEATNALDAKNERAIVENLDTFYQGRTVVVVAHRLSTVKNAGQIVVLDSGKVVETGNHASLIERQGTYYNLVKNQASHCGCGAFAADRVEYDGNCYHLVGFAIGSLLRALSLRGWGKHYPAYCQLIQVPHTLSLRNLDYSLCDTL